MTIIQVSMRVFSKITLLALMVLPITAPCQSAFWHIQRPDGSDAGFLFGTVHSADARVFNRYPGLEDSLLNCDGFAMEANLNEVNPAMLSQGIQMRGDTTLGQLLNKADLLLIETYFRDSLGLPPMLIQRMKPMLSASMVEMKAMKTDQALPMDLMLKEIASQNGLDLSYLETASEQLALFDSIPYYQQAHELTQAVKSAIKGKQSTDTLITLYQNGDMDAIYALTYNDSSSKHFTEVFVDDRNRRMSREMANLLKREKYFMAVGAAHLGGPHGLVTLLEKQGYQLIPLEGI